MLMEVSCDRFVSYGQTRQPIVFHKGLNAVVGTESGTNSVGKSTFLMILDFVFGGDDYIKKSKEVHKITNVGPHVIKFKFEFDGQPYFFTRSTEDDKYNKVVPCDENYQPLEEEEPLSITKYHDFLAEKYGFIEEGQTWRGSVTRAIRVDRRETLDTEKPLKAYKAEPDREGIVALIKLFGLYGDVSDQHKAKVKAADEEQAYKNALSHDFIPGVKNPTEYKKNLEQIETIQALISDLAKKSDEGLLELTSLQAEQISEIRNKIAAFRRQRSIMESQKHAIEQSRIEKQKKKLQSDYQELLQFFPEIDVHRLESVENFHRQLSSILSSELRESERNLDAMIALANEQIAKLEEEQKRISQIPNVTKATLDRYAELQKELLELQSANRTYEKKTELKRVTESLTETLNKAIVTEMRRIEAKLNPLMDEMNETLYDVRIKPPMLSTMSADLYEFSTEDDNGTGMRYKGMILLDIALMRTTTLPFIIHDSLMFSNVEREAIERIIDLYMQEKNKQVFIAIDRPLSAPYRKLVEEQAQVLYLCRGGNELFGKAWNRKKDPAPDDGSADHQQALPTPVEERTGGQLKMLLEEAEADSESGSVDGNETEE